MDANQPAIIVEIIETERHDIKEEVIERVARLLCRADRKNPDEDIRLVDGVFQAVNIPYPANLRWNSYREQALEHLQKIFAR
jgi:hypothetical protein